VTHPESPFFRPLAEDEIETVQRIEKAARIRYRALGGVLARAAEGPAIASERFAKFKVVTVQANSQPADDANKLTDVVAAIYSIVRKEAK
jgi:hypothetical protein